jgi:hypothetical protein
MKNTILIQILVLLAIPTFDLVSEAISPQPIQVIPKLGVSKTGKQSPEWINAVADRNSPEEIQKIKTGLTPLTKEETLWLKLFYTVIPGWEKQLSSVTAPFAPIGPPQYVYILFGNHGGSDGFTYGYNTICIDLSRWVNNYGIPVEDILKSQNRIQRILSHEYTHLLTNRWLKNHPVKRSTPLERALFETWFEGLGNYYSLSSKWYTPDKTLSKRAIELLNHLAPLFVDRLIKLSKKPDKAEEIKLRKGLSTGPFQKKWGAVTTALWLMKDTQCNNLKLKKWIKAGPDGVLLLAEKYLPNHLKEKLYQAKLIQKTN